ncbi:MULTISPECIES: ubiquinol oxidase subunit II [unclassified Vibrio]|uniref:Ubiquinol oxidase subunit 2 n=1 Tax=Vibrio sp. HB236076 TaxID=3232307 RepID=A0AB39HH12_9VIBR|nr:ubiquinol oxidase subunit II [Vibrio sp. HB161653]MDP5255530.1 ubiquinol oxidase subunit II [Vibrio sp. HB161653]
MKKKLLQTASVLLSTLLLSGCNMVLFDSSGVTGKEMGDTILLTMGIMLIVVIPTIALSIWIPYKYHTNKKDETYDPEWEHSTKIELFAWGIPVAIIIVLATITYFTSYSLDPRKEIASDKEPITIQVVALDWKWMFIYPEEKIATINEVAFPVDQPVEFLVTSESTMNSFFMPKLGGQIYAMAGMENRMNIMAFEEGVYRGISANYSGFGFAGMRFKAHVTDEQGYQEWIETVRASDKTLTEQEYERLTEKTRDHQVEYFSSVNPLQFKNIIESFTGDQNGSN